MCGEDVAVRQTMHHPHLAVGLLFLRLQRDGGDDVAVAVDLDPQ